MYLGFKGGGSYNWAQYREKKFLDENQYESKAVFAYQGGVIAHYRVNARWAFRTEFNYLKRGREITRSGTNYVYDRAQYNYVDFPFLFRISFPVKNSSFYIQAGPHMNYFIDGKGEFSSATLRRGGGQDIRDYLILSKGISEEDQRHANRDNTYNIHFVPVNRFQLGLDLGVGIELPILNRNILSFIELRYSHTQTTVARNQDRYSTINGAVLEGLEQDLEWANRSLNLSLGFAFNVEYSNNIR